MPTPLIPNRSSRWRYPQRCASPVPQHVPSALERSVTAAAARARAERIANEKPEDARQGATPLDYAPNHYREGNCDNAKAAPTLDDTESTRERALVYRPAHDVIADAAEARRRAELAARTAMRQQRGSSVLRRTRAVSPGRRDNDAAGRPRSGRLCIACLRRIRRGMAAVRAAQSHVGPHSEYCRRGSISQRPSQQFDTCCFPTPRLILEDVKVGIGQTLATYSVRCSDSAFCPDGESHSSWIRLTRRCDNRPAMLAALPSWTGGRSAKRFICASCAVGRQSIRADVAPLNGHVRFAANGTVQQAAS